jgi:hypothetical protein
MDSTRLAIATVAMEHESATNQCYSTAWAAYFCRQSHLLYFLTTKDLYPKFLYRLSGIYFIFSQPQPYFRGCRDTSQPALG